MNNLEVDVVLKEKIKSESALYYYRATPFTEHGEFNYDGELDEEFFFENMFSKKGNCDKYITEIKRSLQNNRHKSILLIGNQGCGKTTFVHHLQRECSDYDFLFFDFDENTSNPTIAEYIERLSMHLLELLKSDTEVNRTFYNLFIKNRSLILRKINGNNNVNNFFDAFKKTFIDDRDGGTKDNFVKIIDSLYFNQILSLIVLWYLSQLSINHVSNKRKFVFCLDNLDVLVNKEIIEKFFSEYFLFIRNVDSIIQQLEDDYIRNHGVTYNSQFAFIFSCRQHTWARVKEHYPHCNSFFQISTLERNITDAFDKRDILSQRKKYIEDNSTYYGDFLSNIEKALSVLSDMDSTEKYRHNIYDLFDDDYRQCNITFEQILDADPNLLNEYSKLKGKVGTSSSLLYGARGIIYKALFNRFKQDSIFDNIGVLDISAEKPLVSNARMILNFLNYYTYSPNKNNQKYVTFEKVVDAFSGIIEKEDINNALCAMFKLGYSSPWNELIAFNEIHDEELSDCSGLEIFITKAGHEYLSLIATHFEFFNTRVIKKRSVDIPLFSEMSILPYNGDKYQYNFQETISLVFQVVKKCCKKMSEYYLSTMEKKYTDRQDYIESHYVYSDANVLHGERIIHTHIRYIDTYRLFILHELENISEKVNVNKLLIDFIENYIKVGEDYPEILTTKSTNKLFPVFKEKIEIIRKSKFQDFNTSIDV